MPKKGDVVLIPFPFTDLSSQKVRPAVVVSDVTKGDDIVVVFVSSQKTHRRNPMDVLITHDTPGFSETGFKTDSTIRVSKIATLDKKIMLGVLGAVPKRSQKEIDSKLKLLFGL